MKMMIAAALITGLWYTGCAQAVWDTTRQLSRHEGGYATFKSAPRIAVGYNGHFIAEAGYCRSKLALAWLMNTVSTRYAAVQWMAYPAGRYGIWGAKAGYEIEFRFLHMGLEVMAQTDFTRLKGFLVPSAGLTWFGTVGLSYQWLWPLQKKQFPLTNPFQVMLKYNLTKDLAREFRDGVDF